MQQQIHVHVQSLKLLELHPYVAGKVHPGLAPHIVPSTADWPDAPAERHRFALASQIGTGIPDWRWNPRLTLAPQIDLGMPDWPPQVSPPDYLSHLRLVLAPQIGPGTPSWRWHLDWPWLSRLPLAP